MHSIAPCCAIQARGERNRGAIPLLSSLEHESLLSHPVQELTLARALPTLKGALRSRGWIPIQRERPASQVPVQIQSRAGLWTSGLDRHLEIGACTQHLRLSRDLHSTQPAI